MKQSVSSRFRTKPLPALLAACSRLMRWRSTRICLSSVDRESIVCEKASFISGNPSTAGRINSKTRTRSGFFAHPGKAASLMFRARRTRLDMTMRSKGPLRRALSAGGIRKLWMSMASDRRGDAGGGLLDFVAQRGGGFEILLLDGLDEFLLERFEPVGQVAALAQSFGNFADVARSLV